MKKSLTTLAALAVLLAGAGVFGVTLYRATVSAQVEPEGPPPPSLGRTSSAAEADKPLRLRIPAIGVDAHVQHVGIGKSGNMAVPDNYTDVGWYRYGTAPGFVGSAVIDGHVDNGLSMPGVFKRLSELRPGDEIAVENGAGETLRFVVSDIQTYDYKSVPTELLFNRSDVARLNLITCEGAWIAGEKTYEKRLVVYATLSS